MLPNTLTMSFTFTNDLSDGQSTVLFTSADQQVSMPGDPQLYPCELKFINEVIALAKKTNRWPKSGCSPSDKPDGDGE